MKTNHSQTAAFLVFSWMIFLSFFNNNSQATKHSIKDYKPAPAVIIPTTVDSLHQNLTYQADLPPYIVEQTNKNYNVIEQK